MIKKYLKSSIAGKYFFMIFLLIVLPILGFFFFTRLNTLEVSLSQKKTSDLATLDALATNIKSHMSTIELAGHFLSKDENIIDFFEQANLDAKQNGPLSYQNFDSAEVLSISKPPLDSIIAISCLDYNGIPIGENTLNKNRISYFFNSTLMKEIQEKPGASWTKSFSIEFNADHTITRVFAFVVPVMGSDSQPLGYITLFIDSKSLSSFLEPHEGDIYILEGSLVLVSKKEVLTNTSLFSELQFSYSLLLEDSSVIIRTVNDSFIVTTKEFKPLDVQLILTSSYKIFSTNIATDLPSLLTFLLYGLIFAFTSSLLIARLQAKPIIEIQNLMNEVKQGNLSLRTKITTNDEFGELGLTLNSLLDRFQETLSEQKRQYQMQQKMKLQMIQEQVKPHFLYNVLEIISSMIRCNLSMEAITTVEQLANFYRISLSHGSDIISIAQETKLIENYLSLQKTRYVEFMDYILAITPAINKYVIPKFTLQPLIENAIYHGIKEKPTGGLLCISGYLENQNVVFEVFDTGNGIAVDKLKEIISLMKNCSKSQDAPLHFGVASVIRRLNILHNEEITFRIDSCEHEFTCVTISFPAITYVEQED